MAPSPITAMTLCCLALQIARHRHAEAGGDRGGRMRGAERVVFALGALGEAGKPAALAQRADAVAPAGENLVRIGLMADVPDQPVGGRVEDGVQRYGQFDHAQAGAEMAAGLGHRVDGLETQFVGQLPELLRRQVLHVARQLGRGRAGGSWNRPTMATPNGTNRRSTRAGRRRLGSMRLTLDRRLRAIRCPGLADRFLSGAHRGDRLVRPGRPAS